LRGHCVHLWFLSLFTIVFLMGTGVFAASALGQEMSAQVRVVSPESAAIEDEISVDVVVDEVTNLGGFQFVLSFDPEVLEPLSAAKTPFLGSTGRDVSCADATIDDAALRFVCVTLGPTPAGADGSGTVASVKFRAKGAGDSDLTLSRVKLVHPDGELIDSTMIGASISVGESSEGNRVIVYAAIGAVVALLALGAGIAVSRRRGSASAGAAGSEDL